MNDEAGPRFPFPYTGPAEMHSHIVAALGQVVDPDLALSIVECVVRTGKDEPAQRAPARR